MFMSVVLLFASGCSSDDDNTIYGTCNISGTITDIDGAPIEDIPFKDPVADETLGSASITLDFQLAAKPE